MLMPSKVKYRKQQRGRRRGKAWRGGELAFGDMGLQVLEPGAHIRRHAHERSHELLFCYRGIGQADIEGHLHEVCPKP